MSEPLIVATVSQTWNSVMNFNYTNARINNHNFLWIKHIIRRTLSTKYRIIQDFQPNLSIVEVHTRSGIVESFMHKALQTYLPSRWHILLANDEIIPLEIFGSDLLETLHESTIYSIQRKWIASKDKGLKNGNWSFSKLPSRNSEFLDMQFRLVVPEAHGPDRRIHSCCFRYQSSKIFPNTATSILHLDWLMKSPLQRFQKLVNYEKSRKGAGFSRIKYYLPELFDDQQHDWQACSMEERSILDSWWDSHKTFYAEDRSIP